ncbi:exported protein of unknown function [Ralstonia solanacearum CFBP2957]|nr:exported protein of unknown function [Ralstonia solanacearum CFBP2957]
MIVTLWWVMAAVSAVSLAGRASLGPLPYTVVSASGLSCCAAVVGWVLTLVPAFDATPSVPVDDASPPPQPASSAADSAAAASDAVTARDSPARSPVDTLDVFMTMKALLQGDERHRLKQWVLSDAPYPNRVL